MSAPGRYEYVIKYGDVMEEKLTVFPDGTFSHHVYTTGKFNKLSDVWRKRLHPPNKEWLP
mgnify:CR=1 FL=1